MRYPALQCGHERGNARTRIHGRPVRPGLNLGRLEADVAMAPGSRMLVPAPSICERPASLPWRLGSRCADAARCSPLSPPPTTSWCRCLKDSAESKSRQRHITAKTAGGPLPEGVGMGSAAPRPRFPRFRCRQLLPHRRRRPEHLPAPGQADRRASADLPRTYGTCIARHLHRRERERAAGGSGGAGRGAGAGAAQDDARAPA
jgi:hypothetical protein